jgi:Zn-dependent M28 family amino/carboxypeptidase
MRVLHSSYAPSDLSDKRVKELLNSVSEAYLREAVETISIPRHYLTESRNNKFVARWITDELRSSGYEAWREGAWGNVIALSRNGVSDQIILIGAHYDSVPRTPGADDNASAVAAMLACAKAIAEHELATPVCFVAFNCEEDGLVGSSDFVTSWLPQSELKIRQAHILEMVGYCQRTAGSQQIPTGLPVRVPDIGDFLGILGNRKSGAVVDHVLTQAKTYLPEMPVIGLKVYLGVEKYLPVLGRSDHGPFWRANIPAVMWTDTAEFRNPNYHQVTDTPDTLDYTFLRQVSQLLLSVVLSARS